ncbi:MAG: hypothetical protein DMF73_08380 [Acidobacteria bacterium]|nr:MAG: hypothetical protein DMF73_08380 [Acidobacteriota bacterium]
MDEELVRALQDDYRTAPISEQDRIMLDYASQLTCDATRISRGSTISIGWQTLWEWGGIKSRRDEMFIASRDKRFRGLRMSAMDSLVSVSNMSLLRSC